MITIPDRDPVDVPGERARTRSRKNTIPLIGICIAFVIGFAFVSLFMRGHDVSSSTTVAPITAPPGTSPTHTTP